MQFKASGKGSIVPIDNTFGKNTVVKCSGNVIALKVTNTLSAKRWKIIKKDKYGNFNIGKYRYFLPITMPTKEPA